MRKLRCGGARRHVEVVGPLARSDFPSGYRSELSGGTTLAALPAHVHPFLSDLL